MSLNHFDDLNTDHTPDAVVQPTDQDPNAPSVLVSIPPDGFPTKQVTDEQVELLTQAQTKIAVIEDKQSALVDMKDVDGQIAAESAICQQDYHLVTSTFGKDALNTLGIDHFTHIRTKTNLLYTQTRMRSIIAAESARVNNCLTEVLDSLKLDGVGVLNRCNEYYIPACIKAIQQSIADHPDMDRHIRAGFYGVHNNEAVNGATTPIADLQKGVSANISLITAPLNELLQYKHVRLMSYCVSTGTSFSEVVSDASKKFEAESHNATVTDLVDLCSSTKGLDLFAELQFFVQQAAKSISDTTQISMDLSANVPIDPTVFALSKKLHVVKECIAACHYFAMCAQSVNAVANHIVASTQT